MTCYTEDFHERTARDGRAVHVKGKTMEERQRELKARAVPRDYPLTVSQDEIDAAIRAAENMESLCHDAGMAVELVAASAQDNGANREAATLFMIATALKHTAESDGFALGRIALSLSAARRVKDDTPDGAKPSPIDFHCLRFTVQNCQGIETMLKQVHTFEPRDFERLLNMVVDIREHAEMELDRLEASE